MARVRPLLRGATICVCAAVLTFLFNLYQPFYVPSASMLPTLLPGDSVVVQSVFRGCPQILGATICSLLARSPRLGDVIVFRAGEQFLIKRVVGLPGDELAMRDGVLFFNETPVEKHRVTDFAYPRSADEVLHIPRFRETLPGGTQHATLYGYKPAPPLPAPDLNNTDNMVVPPTNYFVMGDDRDHSYDSRMSPAEGGVGMVPEAEVVGVARFILFSVQPASGHRSFLSAIGALRWNRFLRSVDGAMAEDE